MALTKVTYSMIKDAATNIADYGAVGNGTADDTTAIQDAINDAIATSGHLFIPPGTYIASTLTISGSLTVFGSGVYSVIKQQAATADDLLKITGTGNNVIIDNVTFDGNFSNQAAQSSNSMIRATADGSSSLSDVFSVVVQNCEFRNPAFAAVRVQGDNASTTREVAWILNNRFVNGAEGVDNVGQDYNPRDIAMDDSVEAWIENNIFESDAPPVNFGRCAIVVQQTQTLVERLTELHIIGNRISRRGCNVSQSLGAIDLYIWGSNCVVRDNIIKNSYASAIKWKQNAARLTVLNNKIDTLQVAFGTALNGNNPTNGTAKDLCIVEGNQVHNWPGATTGVIVIEGFTTPPDDYSDGIVIRNNQLKDCSGWQIQVANTKSATIDGNQMFPSAGVAGIVATTANDGQLRITNNFVGACSGYAIVTVGTNVATFDSVVNGNTVISNAQTYSIYLAGRRVTCNDNYVADSVGGISLATITDAEVCNNFFKNLSGGTAVFVNGVTNLAIFGNSAIGVTNGAFYNASVTVKRDFSNTWNQVSGTPVTGYYNVSDILWNNAAAAGGNIGWVCTTAGSPGIWKTFGGISV